MIRSNIRNDMSKFVGGTGTGVVNSEDVPLAEMFVLMAFYHATDGPNWTHRTGWGTDPVVGNWYGVTVVNGHVTQLNLSPNGKTLSGPGLQYLSGLTRLTYLNLGNTGVAGDIAALGGLTGLTLLYLHSTGVNGDVSALGGLTGLTLLYLNNTGVNGDIAALTGLTGLTTLNLSYTGVAGDIAALTGLTGLTILYLNNTGVAGDIAALIGLTGLTTLNLRNTGVNVNTVPVFSSDSGTLNISGTNPAPDWGTVDSPNQIAVNINALLNKLWTVTVTGDVPQWVKDL